MWLTGVAKHMVQLDHEIRGSTDAKALVFAG